MSKTEYQLTQHSILIHFHARHEDGLNVCLRASEVKPKLDRFLVKKYGKPVPPGWIRSKNVNGADTALKYRMTITCSGNDTMIYESGTKENRYPENKLPAIFYGNMNAKGNDVKYGVFFKSGLTLTVICFIPELSEFIEKNIAAFFAVTNFGTMQDKGFGSFTVKGKEGMTAKELKEYYDIKKCYCIDTRSGGPASEAQNNIFDTIKQVCSVMKSGQNIVDRAGNTIHNKYIRSFIYVYMHRYFNIGNEKAYMKKNDIAPKRTSPNTNPVLSEDIKQQQLKEYRYVRSLLGIGDHVEWIEPVPEQIDPRPRKEKVSIADVTKGREKIERFASPIMFKVVGSKIYFTANKPDPELFDREFSFTNDGYTKDRRNRSPRQSHSGIVETLTNKEGKSFDIGDFLLKFMDYYNNNLQKLRINASIKVV